MGVHRRFGRSGLSILAAAALLAAGSAVQASTVTQNASWTIDRAGTSANYRVTAYGDSIYAGYYGSISRVAKRAAPWVDGEYLSQAWNADIEVSSAPFRRQRRTSTTPIVAERRIRTATRASAPSRFRQRRLRAQHFAGHPAYATDAAQHCASHCTTTASREQSVNRTRTPTLASCRSNLYYRSTRRQRLATADSACARQAGDLLPYIARINLRACNFASQNGFACPDSSASTWGRLRLDNDGRSTRWRGATSRRSATRTTAVRRRCLDQPRANTQSSTQYHADYTSRTTRTRRTSLSDVYRPSEAAARVGRPDSRRQSVGVGPEWDRLATSAWLGDLRLHPATPNATRTGLFALLGDLLLVLSGRRGGAGGRSLHASAPLRERSLAPRLPPSRSRLRPLQMGCRVERMRAITLPERRPGTGESTGCSRAAGASLGGENA